MERIVTGEEPAVAQHLAGLARGRGADFSAAIESILQANIRSGRWYTFHTYNGETTLVDYVACLVEFYDVYHPYLDALQVQKLDDVWEPLMAKLEQWAYAFVGRWDFAPGDRWQWAMEITGSAGVKLLLTPFPYDIDFEPWACVLVHNIGRSHMRRLFAQREQLSDLWPSDFGLGAVNNGSGRELEERVMDRCDLSRAISALSPRRRELIKQRYFKGRTFSELTELLGSKRSALYKCHYDALNQLRELLG